MRMLGLLFAALIAIGAYYYFMKQAAPGPGMVATQAITTTGVEMDLNAMAQAERTYFAQNGSYADLDQLASSGTLSTPRTGRAASPCTWAPMRRASSSRGSGPPGATYFFPGGGCGTGFGAGCAVLGGALPAGFSPAPNLSL